MELMRFKYFLYILTIFIAYQLHAQVTFNQFTKAITKNDFETIKKYVEDQKSDIHLHNDSALRTAIAHKQPLIIDYLIQHGANVNSVDSSGNTALHYAILDAILELPFNEVNNNIIINLLSVPNMQVNAKNQDGITPLMLAISINSPALVQLLLSHGANISIEDNFKESPLSIAKDNKTTEEIKEMIYNSLAQPKETNTLFGKTSKEITTFLRALIQIPEKVITPRVEDFVKAHIAAETTAKAIEEVKKIPLKLILNSKTIKLNDALDIMYQYMEKAQVLTPKLIQEAHKIISYLSEFLQQKKTMTIKQFRKLFLILKTWQKVLHDPDLTAKLSSNEPIIRPVKDKELISDFQKTLAFLTLQLNGLRSANYT